MNPVVLVDHPDSGAPGFSDLQTIALALQFQVNKHFAPFYACGEVTVEAVTPGMVTPSDWVIGLFKDADQPGALGYHDLGAQPFAKVFPLLDAADGANLSTTISHELLEMLADPFLRLAVQSADGRFYAYEAADAVEQDEYDINGIPVSNFVCPGWYYGGSRLDYLQRCTQPLEVREGGYAQFFDPAHGWQQVLHSQVEPRPYRQRINGRSARRTASLPPALAGDTALDLKFKGV